MVGKITREQYEELCESHMWDGTEEFNKLLEEYTGIKASPYIGYSYYADSYNYVGDSGEGTLMDLLNNAYIEVVDA